VSHLISLGGLIMVEY